MARQATATRKPLTKKLRFDVFKRDGFCCQYCGKTPPGVVLEIDHIHPVSEGGGNGIDNLITACFDCNRGKGAGLLGVAPLSIAEKAEMLAEKAEQLKAYGRLLKAETRREDKEIDEVQSAFSSYFPKHSFTPAFRESVRRFIKDLHVSEVVHSMNSACMKIKDADRCAKYFCGICWSKIKERR